MTSYVFNSVLCDTQSYTKPDIKEESNMNLKQIVDEIINMNATGGIAESTLRTKTPKAVLEVMLSQAQAAIAAPKQNMVSYSSLSIKNPIPEGSALSPANDMLTDALVSFPSGKSRDGYTNRNLVLMPNADKTEVRASKIGVDVNSGDIVFLPVGRGAPLLTVESVQSLIGFKGYGFDEGLRKDMVSACSFLPSKTATSAKAPTQHVKIA